MFSRKRTRKIEADQSYLKIPDVTKPPSDDGIVDYTILPLEDESTRIREIDRITQMARNGVYRKNLFLLRKERNLLTAVQLEQIGNYDNAIACYERAANFAERLELFEESERYRNKVKSLSKLKQKTSRSHSKKRGKRDHSKYSLQDLESKPILPKGVTIPLVDPETAEKFRDSHMESEEDDDDLF